MEPGQMGVGYDDWKSFLVNPLSFSQNCFEKGVLS